MYNPTSGTSGVLGSNQAASGSNTYLSEYPYQPSQLHQQLASQHRHQQHLQHKQQPQNSSSIQSTTSQAQPQQPQPSQQQSSSSSSSSPQQPQQAQQAQSSQYNYASNQARTSNNSISSKFTPQDIQVLRQLLGPGEKHKWKQITKDINQSSPNKANTSSSPKDKKAPGQAKNVSPTFVIKQYQTLLGLPNNALYFGSLGSSLPYVTAANGWHDIEDQAHNHQFSDYMK